MGFSSSDEAKVAYLQEMIREARRNQTVTYVVTFVILLLGGALFGFIGGYMGFPLALWENIGLVLAGVILAMGFGIGSYYGYQKNKLMEQLKQMAESTSKQNE